MKQMMKKISRKLGHGLATFLSIMLVVTIVALVSLQALVLWLNSNQGSDWLAAQVTKAVETTPYSIELQNFALHGLFGIGADRLVVSDKDGEFLRLENAGIDLDIWPLPLKTAWLNVDAQYAELLRMPKPPEKNLDRDPEEEFVFPEKPDMYFTSLVLNMNVKNLVMSENIIAGGVAAAVKTRHRFDIKKDILAISGDYNFANFKGEYSDYIPKDLAYKINGHWGQDSLEVQNFKADRPGYFSTEGQALYVPLANDLDISLKAMIEQGLNKDLTKPLEIRAQMKGAITEYKGLVEVKGEISNRALDLKSPVNGNQQFIHFVDLSGQGAGTDISGNIKYYFSSGLLQGNANVTLPDMNLVKGFIDAPELSGNGSVKLNLDIADGQQIYSGHADLKNIVYDTTRIHSAEIDAVPTRDFKTVAVQFKIDGHDQHAFSISGNGSYDASLSRLNIENTILKSAGGDIKINGWLGADDLDLSGRFNKLDLNTLPFIEAEDEMPLQINAGTISLSGQMSSPVIVADIFAIPTEPDARQLKMHINGVYQSGSIDIDTDVTGPGIENLTANLKMPATISISPAEFTFSEQTPLNGTVQGDFNLMGISPLILPEGNSLSGRVIADASVSGSVDAPVLNGRLDLSNGRYKNDLNGIDLRNMKGAMRLSGQNIIIETLSATDGQNGRLNISGDLNFANGFPPVANLQGKAERMRVMQGTKYQVALNADMKLNSGEDGGYILSGTAFPDKIIYTLPERFDTRIPELNIVDVNAEESDPLLELIALDMIFDSKKNVFIRGWGLDVQLGGSLYIGGTAEDPDVRGNLNVVRGNFEEFGRRFDLAESTLRFQGSIPPSPYLNITAVAGVDDYDLKVLIRGTAQDPKITFASTPSMPEDQVLAYILFGKNVTQISPFQALQLANTLRKFSGKGGGLDPVGQLQKATGLDDLRIEGGTGEGVTVGAGKYLSDDVYLEVQQNSGDEGAGAAKVEIELTPRITVESQVGTRGETGGGIFWEWDY